MTRRAFQLLTAAAGAVMSEHRNGNSEENCAAYDMSKLAPAPAALSPNQ